MGDKVPVRNDELESTTPVLEFTSPAVEPEPGAELKRRGRPARVKIAAPEEETNTNSPDKPTNTANESAK